VPSIVEKVLRGISFGTVIDSGSAIGVFSICVTKLDKLFLYDLRVCAAAVVVDDMMNVWKEEESLCVVNKAEVLIASGVGVGLNELLGGPTCFVLCQVPTGGCRQYYVTNI